MMPPTPLKRLTLAQQIKEVLLTQITSGELKPGDRLVELKIAKDMSTSQAPVREALRELEALGVIDIKPNRGTIIRTISDDQLREIYQIRQALEALAIQAVAQEASHLGIKLMALCDRMEASERMNYSGAFISLQQEFHDVIVKGSGNQTLIDIWEKLTLRARIAQTASEPHTNSGDAIEVYRDIAQSVSNKDGARASELLSAHIQSMSLMGTK